MSTIRLSTEKHVTPSASRINVFIGIITFIVIVFVVQLVRIQAFENNYKQSAKNNSIRRKVVYPSRGIIYDRTGKILVYNEVTYDISAVPRELRRFDTTLLCDVINYSIIHNKKLTQKQFNIDSFRRAFKKNLTYMLYDAQKESMYKPKRIFQKISSMDYVAIQEVIYKFPGFYIDSSTVRKYPLGIASHLLGYVGEVDPNFLKKDTSNYYRSGDDIGISGVEKTYEYYLRGQKGVRHRLVDVYNTEQGDYLNGINDTAATSGMNVVSTIDAELQAYGEELMKNKIGSIVAIEPSTGEILALVTSPTYNPNLLSGRSVKENYPKLLKSDKKPLFNRALMASYPPGSTFKIVNALVGLQEGVITTETSFPCGGGFHIGGLNIGCHHSGSVNFTYSIQGSCNSYYCFVYRKILDNRKYKNIQQSYNIWKDYLNNFGLGVKLKSDLANELAGNVPKSSYFDGIYPFGWKSLTVISMAFGQGELGVTPFQMANLCACIANRGYYYIPHAVKRIKYQKDTFAIDKRFRQKQWTTVTRENYEHVITAMELVVLSGTATSAKIKDIPICGKTGTAENPHGEDHSIFMAFAPKINPKIAISVYIENGGYGATYAAPISSLMIEKYITRKITRESLEKRMMEAELIPTAAETESIIQQKRAAKMRKNKR